jgi:hypothetical protein
MKYIGGEIEFITKDNDINNNYKNYINESLLLYSTGRTAIVYILKTLSPRFPVLLPSYMCSSILQPFHELNINYDFYKVNMDFSIDETYLLEKLSKVKYSALFSINYFGLKDNQQILRRIKQYFFDLILIEDLTQITFIPNIINNTEFIGDIVFGSLRKTMPIADGAFIIKNINYDFKYPKKIDIGFSELKSKGKEIRRHVVNDISVKNKVNLEFEKLYLELLSNAEEIVNSKIPDTTISDKSRNILLSINFEQTLKKRQSNYNKLYEMLSNDIEVNKIGYCPFELNKNYMPYMMPFYVKNGKRDKIRKEMKKFGVFAAIIWSSMPRLKQEIFFDTYYLKSNLLCFHVDQRYNENDMEYMFEILKRIVKS